MASRDTALRTKTWDSVFQPVRQPDWWQGDKVYHPPAYTEPVSELERRLKAGEFVVTSEVAPPQTTATKKLIENIKMIKPYVAAINFTDCPSATPRMSSWACSTLSVQNGAEAVMQIAARDRTRVGLQAEVLGANALGVRNILCLSGDSMKMAPNPRGRMDIVDIDSVQMLWILRRMRDEGRYLDGREIKTPPQFFLGAGASPYAAVPRYEAIREEKKVNAGAQFIQTQPVIDYGRFTEWLEAVEKRNILDRVYILAGMIPLKSAKAAHAMAEVPGVVVPPEIIKRMDNAKDEKEEGVAIAREIIEKLKNTKGIHGIHFMAVFWEEIVPRLIDESGLPKPLREAQPAPA